MKKVYTKPELNVYGSVEQMTQFFDLSSSSTDFLFFPGNVTLQSKGSKNCRIRFNPRQINCDLSRRATLPNHFVG